MTTSVALGLDRNGPLETERPDLGTALIPKDRYTSRAFAEREWRGLWSRHWQIAGPASDLTAPGDYFTFEFGTESVLVVRQQDGEVGAYYNVCSHRGNRLVPPGRGNARRFSCAFHGWCYGNDGALLEALDAHTFPQGLARDELGLPPVRSEVWAGFVWLNFSAEPEPLADFLGPVAAEIELYDFEKWAIDYDVTIEIDCNWKTCVDAFNESYHVTATHPQALPVADDINCPIDFYGRHSRLIFHEGVASPRHAEHGSVTREVRDAFLQPAGIDVAAVGDDPKAARKALAEARRAEAERLGVDVSKFSDDRMIDNFSYTLFPNVTFSTHSLFTWVFRHRPHPDDPNKMYFDLWSLVRQPKEAAPRPEHITLLHSDIGRDNDPRPEFGGVLAQDLSNLVTVQQGMRSEAFAGLYLSSQEIRIRHFHSMLMRCLEDAP